jgi:hypothetical protein
VTLIGAFRYGIDTPDSGVVICADSLEQMQSYRAFVKKIESRSTDLYDMVIAGAGNCTELIDDQIEALVDTVRGWRENNISEEDAKSRIRNVISSYHRRFVVPFQASTEDKYLQFIVCLRSKQSGTLFLWKIESTVISSVPGYALIGYHDGIYYYETEWLWRPDLTMNHAALLGIRLLSIAKNNPEIGGPTRVLAVNNTGVVEPYDEAKIEALGQMFEELDDQIAGVILGCTDLTLPYEELMSRFRKFQNWATSFRSITLEIQSAHLQLITFPPTVSITPAVASETDQVALP